MWAVYPSRPSRSVRSTPMASEGLLLQILVGESSTLHGISYSEARSSHHHAVWLYGAWLASKRNRHMSHMSAILLQVDEGDVRSLTPICNGEDSRLLHHSCPVRCRDLWDISGTAGVIAIGSPF